MYETEWIRCRILIWFFIFLSNFLPKTSLFGMGFVVDPTPLDEIEMGTRQGKGSEMKPLTSLNLHTMMQFGIDYNSAGSKKRLIFEKYLNSLGSEFMLDFLEAKYPYCHTQAHELGQAIFARVKEIGKTLRECKTRCTSGCMHGALMEALGSSTLRDITAKMDNFCKEGEIAEMHKPGNCAHGIGHALMFVSGNDIEESLKACSSFPNPAMGYYCATGVFMELLLTGKRDILKKPQSLHYPCDTYTKYPAACYRYKVAEILRALRGNRRKKLVDECLSLPSSLRLGCFHGLGSEYRVAISRDPHLLPEVCGYGTPEDQAICIEGAIEKLADYDEKKALEACATLDGENAVVCRAAAKEKMYRLNKPTMRLYYGQ
jgi:hypothetical protein